MTDAYIYVKSDFEFDFFMATVGPSQFTEFEWRLFQAFRRNRPANGLVRSLRRGVTEQSNRSEGESK